jgi:hypothetical protein
MDVLTWRQKALKADFGDLVWQGGAGEAKIQAPRMFLTSKKEMTGVGCSLELVVTSWV